MSEAGAVTYRPFRRDSDGEAVLALLHELNRYEAGLGAPRDLRRSSALACLDEDCGKVRQWGGDQIVAVSGPDILGYIAMTLGRAGPFVPREIRDHVYVETLVVAGDFRGRGIGGTLLRHAEDLARMHGYNAVSLGVVPGNESAAHLYRRAGFTPTAIEMRKILD